MSRCKRGCSSARVTVSRHRYKATLYPLRFSMLRRRTCAVYLREDLLIIRMKHRGGDSLLRRLSLFVLSASSSPLMYSGGVAPSLCRFSFALPCGARSGKAEKRRDGVTHQLPYFACEAGKLHGGGRSLQGSLYNAQLTFDLWSRSHMRLC